jgi:hypothetical protein
MKRLPLRKIPRIGWLALAVAGVLLPLTVYSVVYNDVFELDGNATTAGSGDDWDRVANGNDKATPGVFVQDTIPPAIDRIFIGGGSKDERDISGANSWSHTDGTPPDKNDIEHAFAGAYFNGPELLIYFGADRFANNGDSAVGFWFFQDNVGANADGSFSGKHIPGDILITSDFRNGGGVSVINVFKWVGGRNPLQLLASGSPAQPGSPNTPACLQKAGVDVACAIANRTATPVPAVWPGGYTFKGGGNGGNFPISTLFEGGINITQLLGTNATCFSSFMAMTRTSASTTAQLKDFVVDRFPLCGISVSKTCNGTTTVSPDGAHFRNEYTVAITNTGAGPVHDAAFVEAANLDGDHSCKLTEIDGQDVADVPLVAGSAQTIASLLPSGGVATAKVQCDTLDNPFTNSVSAQAYAAPPVQGQPLPLLLTTDVVANSPACTAFQIEGELLITKACANRHDANNVLVTPAVTMNASLVPKVCVDIGVTNDSNQRVTGIQIVDDMLSAAATPAPFALDPGASRMFENLCYTPDTGDDPLETNPGKISFTDQAYAEGTGVLTQQTLASAPVTATCKLCPSCPDCAD